jgi:hypothetical protein
LSALPGIHVFAIKEKDVDDRDGRARRRASRLPGMTKVNHFQ